MDHHPRNRENMYVSRAVQAERERKTAEAHEYYRQLVRTRARGDASHAEPESTQLAEAPASTAPARPNAWKHGLCAEVLGVEPEENEVFNQLLEQLRMEYLPAGPTEELLVRDLWRHACFLHLCARAESGQFRLVFTRRMARAEHDDNELHDADVSLGDVACSERAALIARYRRTHERGFLEVQRRLMELRAYRDAQARIGPPVLPATALPAVDARTRDALLQRFSRHEDCVEHIRAHRQRGNGPACPRCRKKPMTWEDERRLWRCSECGEQMTILWGTLIARSRLPITAWFGAVVHLMFEPDLTVAELQHRLDLPREATASTLRDRILRRLPPLGAPDERLKTCLFVK